LAIDPNDIGSLYHKAIALTNLARYEEAVSVYDKILSLNPIYETNLQALQGKANALFDLGRYEEAVSTYDKLLAIEPNMVNANISKADALSNLGRYDEAIAEYDKVLEYYPEEVRALEGKGNALFNLGRYEEALTYFDKILSGDASDIGLYVAASEKRQLVLDAINKVNVTDHSPKPGNNNSSMTNITAATNVSTS
jgi:tetratricopeptide (TPR) repeat protein